MSQKYPASVCSLSSFWATDPPCCVYSSYYTSVCCERRICKICRSVSRWCGEAFVLQALGVWESCGAHWLIPCQSRGVRGSCRIGGPVAMGTGLSAGTILPNDAVWYGQGASPAIDPCWPGRALGLCLLPGPLHCALTRTHLCCVLPGTGKVLEFRKDEVKQACSRAFSSSAKHQMLPGDSCQKPSGEGETGTPWVE